MTEIVAVVVNGELTIRYDRSRALTDRQRESLDGLDRRMEQEGVELEGARIIAPDLGQRSRFVADRIEARATRQGRRAGGFKPRDSDNNTRH